MKSAYVSCLTDESDRTDKVVYWVGNNRRVSVCCVSTEQALLAPKEASR